MPKLKIANFSGGINNEIEPHLLDNNLAVDLLDADVKSGGLVPFNDKGRVANPDLPELSNQDGKRSLVRFGEHFFFTDNTTGEFGSTLGFIGITPPDTAVTVVPGVPGDHLVGLYRYMIVFETETGVRSNGFLPGEEGLFTVDVDTHLAKTIVLNQVDFPAYSRAGDTSFPFIAILSRGRHFGYSEGTRVSHDNKFWRLKSYLAFKFNTSAPSLNVIPIQFEPGGTANVWEDISGITESADGAKSILISNFPAPVEDAVTKILIFRSVDNGTELFLAGRIGVGEGSFEDSLSDGKLVLNEQLIRENALPPIFKDNTRVGGKFLIEVNERYWAANGEFLYHSRQSDIHRWNPLHRSRFDGEITALARFGNGIIVFTGNGNPIRVTGNVEQGTLTKTEIQSTQGCPNSRTISYAGNTPVWHSNDGICVMQQRPQGQDPIVVVITKGRYVFSSIGNHALVHKDIYYLFFDDHAVVFDFGRNIIYRRSLTADFGFDNHVDGVLYLVLDNEHYSLNSGSVTTMSYTGPEFSFGDIQQQKTFNELSANSEKAVEYKVLIDGEELDSDTLTGSIYDTETEVRAGGIISQNGYRIQIKMDSNKKIRSYTIDYSEVR